MAEKGKKKTSEPSRSDKKEDDDHLSVTISFDELIKLSVSMPDGEDREKVEEFIKEHKPKE